MSRYILEGSSVFSNLTTWLKNLFRSLVVNERMPSYIFARLEKSEESLRERSSTVLVDL